MESQIHNSIVSFIWGIVVDCLRNAYVWWLKLLIQNDSFDYTKWQNNLFNDMTLEELSLKAMDHRKNM